VSGPQSEPLASLPRYQSAAEPRRSEDSVWRLLTRGAGLEPRSVAAVLRHTLAPSESLFRGVLRVPVPLPSVQRGRRVAPGDEARLEEALLAAWSDTVEEHLEAGARDVSLSGGLDSAALCAMAARHAGSEVRAWTMRVHFADATEQRNAALMARTAGVELVEVPIPDAVLPDLLEPAVLANETAIINARAVASFAFYSGARKLGAGLLMSGAGADEVLMGNLDALGGVRARVAEDRELARQVLRDQADVEARESWGMEQGSLELRYGAWVLRELILPPELRGAQAHGLTVRTPYLSSRFAELALSLPAALLVREQTGKWLFRQALGPLVPQEIRFAPKTPRYARTALSSPVRERWLELYRAWLSPARLAPLEVIDATATLALLDRYVRLSPEDPLASAVDRLLMRLVSFAMLQAHAEALAPCPES